MVTDLKIKIRLESSNLTFLYILHRYIYIVEPALNSTYI